MCEKGWCVGLGQEGVVCGWGKLSEIPYGGLEPPHKLRT